jgi:signal transduction histidine kinase
VLARTLYDLTQLLESADRAEDRVRHVLQLLGALVPFEQCAVLEARLGYPPHVVLVPEAPTEERARITDSLLDMFAHLVGENAIAGALAARPDGAHLAVPLVGLDEVIGLLFVRSSAVEYTEEHLRALSVIGSKLAAYFTMLRGHAELAEVARQRDEARRSAEDANRAKDEFLALVSHELKTPLSSILAWAHHLRSIADDTARAAALEEIERNVHTQTRLIDGILDLACIASAELRLNLRIMEPAALIRASIDGLRLEAERKSIRLASDLDGAAMPLILDPGRIGQAVSILVANAIQETPAGGLVGVRLQRAAGYARIQVTDYASGIRAEPLPLGLAIVKELVELHGGRVGVENAGPNRGTTFTIELPRVADAQATHNPLATAQGAETGVLAGVRVVLVDHDLGLRESFQLALADHGAEVTAVASAPEALAALERSRPDVLLCGDLPRCGESAYELLREVMARACPIPVASISAWRLEANEDERTAGFRLHLAKPIDIAALVDAVAHLAGRKRGPARLFAVPREEGTPRRR